MQAEEASEGRDFVRIAPDVRLGRTVEIFGFVTLYGCTIGDETKSDCFRGSSNECRHWSPLPHTEHHTVEKDNRQIR